MKVETHNHPTAIARFRARRPVPVAKSVTKGPPARLAPKAGLTGFSVSNLNIPGFRSALGNRLWQARRIASALDIMIEGPLGGAAFNNEFGRPNLNGYFRTLEIEAPGVNGDEMRGYHKPIMIAGGIGNIRGQHVSKHRIPPGAKIIVLGGPALLIGLGGGAASIDGDRDKVPKHWISRRCSGITRKSSAAVRK
jgi:phosphoribosylformylglycinamidine synthase